MLGSDRVQLDRKGVDGSRRGSGTHANTNRDLSRFDKHLYNFLLIITPYFFCRVDKWDGIY